MTGMYASGRCSRLAFETSCEPRRSSARGGSLTIAALRLPPQGGGRLLLEGVAKPYPYIKN
jgi:hypothetical protein